MNLQEIKKKTEASGQTHLLKYVDELNEKERKQLLAQIEEADFSLLEKLHESQSEKKERFIQPLDALEVDEINKNRKEYEEIGLEQIRLGKVGAVLLAGGQGTRLGFDKPKGMFNVGVNRDLYIFECLINNLLDVTNKANAYVPFYIMCSEKNYEDTVGFFEEHDYFRYPKEYVSFFKQEMVPAVDFSGKIYLESKSSLSLSPNGNGGWFSSMAKAGLLEELKERKIEWLNVFSVDNVLQRIADPVFIGATIKQGCVSGGKVVRKAEPHEKIGVLCLEDGRPQIVEYYEMTQDMISLRNAKNELAYNFGVTLNYIFKEEKLEEILNANMPIHVVEKKIPYLNENGETVTPDKPNGYKFETLALDMVHLMDNCLPFECIREHEFAPIKNATGVDSVETARELLKLNHVEL